MLNRRFAIKLLGLAPIVAQARANTGENSSVKGDNGEQLQSFPVPSGSDPSALPDILWKGERTGDVLVYEFFDYNCGFCRKAAGDLDAILKQDRKLRIGLINNPILSIGSVQAAKVELAMLRLHGPDVAYDFHMRIFGKRGLRDGVSALEIVKSMGLSAGEVEKVADSSEVSEQLSVQLRFASKLDLMMTPSFIMAGVVILGWPGKKSFQSIIANMRQCNRPVCA